MLETFNDGKDGDQEMLGINQVDFEQAASRA
jgi:hypothetical protein